MVYRKSIKTVKLFSHITFIVYGNKKMETFAYFTKFKKYKNVYLCFKNCWNILREVKDTQA